MPIYTYSCTKCRNTKEITLEIGDTIPDDLGLCQARLPQIIIRDVEWIDENDVPRMTTTPEYVLCNGTMRRKYDTFHFHISGR